MLPKLFITGGSGYLGRCLVRRVAETWPPEAFNYSYYSTDPLQLEQGQPLDLRQAAAVRYALSSYRPDVILHLAGSNRGDDLTGVIVDGTRHVADTAAALGARLIHVSSDALFDGAAAPYVESARPAPLNEYGRAKAAAEQLVAEAGNHAIVRTSLIYGLSEMDHGTAWMAAALRAGEPVTLFTNQRRNPVWVETLSAALLELATGSFTGVIHVAGEQALSRAEFGVRMLDYWGVEARQTLTLAEDHSGRWPLDCELDLSLAKSVLQTPLPGVDKVLALARPALA